MRLKAVKLGKQVLRRLVWSNGAVLGCSCSQCGSSVVERAGPTGVYEALKVNTQDGENGLKELGLAAVACNVIFKM